jgi:ATP-dependent Clp protease ATP-binding subunit ClpA
MSAIPASARPPSPRAWRAASSRARCPKCSEGRDHLRARHGRAAGRHALPRRLRGAPEAGGQGAGEPAGAILFIDEIHTVIGAGATSGGAMDASNLLKPALRRARCAASARPPTRSSASYFEKDRALVRRFQKIDVNEPTVEDAVKILKGLKPYYEEFHKVKLHQRGDQGRRWSCRPLHQRPQAAGQGDRRDRRGGRLADAAARGKRKKTIGVKEIEAVVAKIARIPPKTVSKDDTTVLRTWRTTSSGRSSARTKPSSPAVQRPSSWRGPACAIRRSRSAATCSRGPTGVGKTEAAKPAGLDRSASS